MEIETVVVNEVILLSLTSKENLWELECVTLKEVKNNSAVDVYVCRKNGELQWAEGSQGCALSRFSNIIPNEIANP